MQLVIVSDCFYTGLMGKRALFYRFVLQRKFQAWTGVVLFRPETGSLPGVSCLLKEKLVIVVTHNFDEVEQYATRKIRLQNCEVTNL